jgi:hypothetical protein
LRLPSAQGHSLGVALWLRALVSGTVGRPAAVGLRATSPTTAAGRVEDPMSTVPTAAGLGTVARRT